MSRRGKRAEEYRKLGNKPLNKPIVIAVEGIDWFHFLREQISDGQEMKPDFEDVQLFNFGSITSLDGLLEVFRDDPEIGNLRALGIMRDVEEYLPQDGDTDTSKGVQADKNNRENVIKSVRSVLLNYGFSAPNEPKTISDEKPIAVSYLLIPDGAETGCLEHAILRSAKDATLQTCADEFVDCIDPTNSLTDNERAKVAVRSLIATNPKRAYTLGQSVHSGLWDLEHESVRVMLDFIRSLVSLLD